MLYLKIPLGDSAVFAVRAYSPDDAKAFGIDNWSLKLTSQKGLKAALASVFQQIGVHDVYAPNIKPANARIMTIAEFNEPIKLADDVRLYRNQDFPADGMSLDVGETTALIIGGCPIVLATAGEHTIVAHAGRTSLLDPGMILGKPTRKNVSVVDSIVETFAKWAVTREEIIMRMMFAIPADVFEHPYDHPKYSEYNNALTKYIKTRWPDCSMQMNGSLFLDLEDVFKRQAVDAGVKRAYATDSLAQHRALAHTRDGNNPARRNLIVIKRTS
jgi:hypothetical protein